MIKIDAISNGYLLNRYLAFCVFEKYSQKVSYKVVNKKKIKYQKVEHKRQFYQIQWLNIKNDLKWLIKSPSVAIPHIAYSLLAFYYIFLNRHLDAINTAFFVGSIAYDNTSTNTNSTDPTSLTISHLSAGDYMVGGSSTESDTGGHTAQTVSTFTYNSVGLSNIRNTDYITDNGTELWGLVAPSAGTFNAVITMTAVVDGLFGAVLTFTGVDQANPVDNSAGTTGGGLSISQALTPNTANAMLVNIMHHQNSAAVKTADADQTQRFNVATTGDFSTAGGTRLVGAVASYTTTWSVDINEATSMTLSIVSLKEATTGIRSMRQLVGHGQGTRA